MVKFIDTHIHLQDIKADFAPQVLDNPDMQGVLTVSAKKEDWGKIEDLMNLKKVSAAFGIHPWYAADDVDELETYLQKYPSALVGEIGLDGTKEIVSLKQHQCFAKQLEIAKYFGRPVVLHIVKAYEDFRQYENKLKDIKFVLHGVGKNSELVKFVNKCQGYFGISQRLFKCKNVREILTMIPEDKMLFETDAPFGVNEEKYAQCVQENLQLVATLTDMTVEKLSEKLYENAREFINVGR